MSVHKLLYDINSYRCTDGVGVKCIQSHTNGGQCSHNSTKSTKKYLQKYNLKLSSRICTLIKNI